MSLKNIIFMGTPGYALSVLKALVENDFNILAVFSQADKKVGRKQILTPSVVKAWAKENLECEIYTPKSLKDEGIISEISRLKPDFIVVAAYGKVLPKAILDLAPCVNLHASLLPKYRGASPIQSAILAGEKTSGVCSMLMNEGLDTGDILQSLECDITGLNSPQLFDKLANLAAKLCVETLNNFENLKPVAQDDAKASHCAKIKKEDGLINLENARQVYRKFLAFYEWPGVFLADGLKLLDIEFVDDKAHEKVGQILGLEKDGFLLSCKLGTLKIKAVQEPGKKSLDARTYLNGKRLKSEDYLS